MALQEEFEVQGNWLFKHRSYIPLIILVAGFIVFLQKEFGGEFLIINGKSYDLIFEMFSLFVGLVGLFVRSYTVGFTPKNTSGRNTKGGQVADQLNTTGIYSLVRHPLYVGNFLMWLAVAMLTFNLWFIVSFVLFYWVYYERIMYAEEQFLRKKFGEQYLVWAEKVPAFVPKFTNFQKPKLSFSWKKVIKKEKNGLFALFLIFTLFDVSGELIKEQDQYNYFLMAATALTGLSYIVLKILKMNTSILDEADR